MNILHLAPLWFPVSQDASGGIETYLPGLLGGLERLGCHNTLIASGDSRTAAEVVPAVPQNLCAHMEAGLAWEYPYYEQHQLLLTLERAAHYDVVHSHVGWGAYVLSGVPGLQERVLHTHHNPVTRDLEWFVHQHPDLWLSTVSASQARRLWQQGASRCHVIHNGIDVAAFTFQPAGGEGLLFLGRMEHEKGPDLAVQVAHALQRPLILAGPIIDEEFFASAIKPFLDDQIRYVGVVDHRRKNELFGQAGCVLMPSRWDEPFGMVSIEAMACGTPVVALANGALPEIIEAGLTGYVTTEEQGLAPLVTQALTLDRATIRARVTARFSLSLVAEKYRQLYTQIAAVPRSASVGGHTRS